jgi:outer membrane protein
MRKRRLILILLALCTSLTAGAQTNIRFTSLEEVFIYADNHSSTFQNSTQQNLLARYETVAANLATFNLKGDAVLSSVNNTQLPVSFLPGELVGQPVGTFKKVTLGLQYTSAATFTPQIDILSPYALAKIKIARANERLTSVNNLISKRDLYQSVAGTYYNILSDQWQIEVTRKTLENADSVVRIFRNKLEEGVSRPQDVNSAVANSLSIQDKLQQLEVELAQQYNALKTFCDIDPGVSIEIPPDKKPSSVFEPGLAATDDLSSRQYRLQQEYQVETLRADKKWFYPTLTAYGSLSWQQYSNDHLYGKSAVYPINYIGLRLTVPLLPDANKIAAVRYDRVNLRIAEIAAKHAALQDTINNIQTELDYQKAFRSYQLSAQIAVLKEEIYRKNLNIYNEGILSATDLFTSFNDWLNSSLSEQAQMANSEYSKAKILITHFVK